MLVQANPPPNATVSTAPKALALSFSERVDLPVSQVVVRDSAGHEVQITAIPGPGASPSDAVVKLWPLTPGVYRVEWHAIGKGSRPTTGNYRFTVAP